MYRITITIWLMFISSSLVWAINDDTSGFQMDTNLMDTNMSDNNSPKQNDSTLRFLQALTNQQEEIQNLNLAIQKEKRQSKIERENLEHRISFLSFLLWGVLAINGVLLFIFIIMGFRLRSFSSQMKAFQIELDAIQTEVKNIPLPDNDQRSQASIFQKQKTPSVNFDLSPSEEQELEGLLTSEHDNTIISDNEGQHFFNQFKDEIDRERAQLKQSNTPETEKSENDMLDELIEQHFSDADLVTISSKGKKPA